MTNSSKERAHETVINQKNWLAWLVIFLVAAVLVLLQSALTRVLSASSDYHATFFVIAFVMLGLAASSMDVYQKVHLKQLNYHLIGNALSFACIFTVSAYMLFSKLLVPVLADQWKGFIFLFGAMLFYYPFQRCGFAVAGILYLQRRNASWIYWGDLLGASLASALMVFIFNFFSSPLVFVLCSCLLAGSAIIIISVEQRVVLRSKVVGVFVLSLAFLLFAIRVPSATFLPFPEKYQTDSLNWEKWSGLARIGVFDNKSERGKYVTAGWGMSSQYKGEIPEFKWLNIDSGAGTQIIKKIPKKSSKQLEYLRWDVTSVAYEFLSRPIKKVFIIGGGGGRDIITASLNNAQYIHVAELNPLIVEAVNEVFGEYSGRPYSFENVKLTIGEGRHVLSKSDEEFDLIQMSMIDTFAASAAGTFALSENSLYTVEAFELFIKKLSPTGIFSLSRWWLGGSQGETGRAILMVLDALKTLGMQNPSSHLVVFFNKGELLLPVSTILVSKNPFSEVSIKQLQVIANSKGFELLWPGDSSESRGISKLLDNSFDPESEKIFDLSLSRDDRPFFFNTKNLIGSWTESIKQGDLKLGSRVTLIFLMTFLILIFGSYLLIYRSAMRIMSKLEYSSRLNKIQFAGVVTYFASIGIGFMFIEIGLLQRFTIFLGHPNYALSTVLFCLLFFCSIGSLLSNRLSKLPTMRPFICLVIFMVCYILFDALLLPQFLLRFYGSSLVTRMLIAVLFIAPGAFAMGMFLPFGICKLNDLSKDDNIPLAWAINGIFSVVGATFATLLALVYGFTILLLITIPIYSSTILGIILMTAKSREKI